MMQTRIGKALVCLAIFSPLVAIAADQEAKITVSVSPNPVPERESLQLQIEVDTPLSTVVKKPTFESPDLIVMGEPGMNFTPQDGPDGPNSRKKLIFTYVLMPKRAGDFVIRNIQVGVGRQVMNAHELRVRVTPDSSSPAQEDSSNPAAPGYKGRAGGGAPPGNRLGEGNHPAQFHSDFTVFCQVSKLRAYVGEPIVVEYFLYDFGHLRQSEVKQWPEFNNFWKEDLELATQYDFEEVFVRNQEMRRAFLARYAVFGSKPGKFYMGQLGIRGKYRSNTSVNSFFGFELKNAEHYSQNVQVDVIPLPEAGRPAKFGGAVGRFSLKLEADKLSLPQNTPVNITLTLTGVGNFQAIDSIKPQLPPDFEIYESTANGRPPAPIGMKQSLESKKTFHMVAIPRKAGKFEIPAVVWSYFNPEKEAYETLTTSPLQLEVTENQGGAAAGANTYLSPKDAKLAPVQDNELRYLKPVALDTKRGFDLMFWALWLALGLNGWAGFTWIKGRSRSLFRLVKSMDRFSEARILLLQAKGIRDSEWQAGLEEVALRIVEVLLGTSSRGFTKSELEEAWKSRALPAPLFQRVSALLEELDRHRFSSQKLTGSGTTDLRSRLTKETESLLIEASRIRKK